MIIIIFHLSSAVCLLFSITIINIFSSSSSGDSTKAFVEPRITEITMELLEIIRQTENDDLTTVNMLHNCLYYSSLAINLH